MVFHFFILHSFFFFTLFDWAANHKKKALKLAPAANVMNDRSMSKRYYMAVEDIDSVSRGCWYMDVFVHVFMGQVSCEKKHRNMFEYWRQ